MLFRSGFSAVTTNPGRAAAAFTPAGAGIVDFGADFATAGCAPLAFSPAGATGLPTAPAGARAGRR